MIMRVIEQTREEREAMYMKMTKKKLIQMLMNNQDAITDLIHTRSTRWQERTGAELGC
jgi:arsenate reductase-like glutaredoxin family protein